MKRKPKQKRLDLHPSLLGTWTPRRCLYLGPATEIEELCKLLNRLQTVEHYFAAHSHPSEEK